MPRTFPSANGIAVATGQIPTSDQHTFLAVVNVPTLTSTQTIISINSAAGNSRLEIQSSGTPRSLINGSNQAWSTTHNFTAGMGWVFIAVSKDASGNFRRCTYSYATGTLVTSTSTSALTGTTDALTSAFLGGRTVNGFSLIGDMAAVGAFSRYISSATDLANYAFSLGSWLSLGPGAMWVLDQASTSVPVLDWTGGGANQTAITGTSVATTSAPIGYGHPVALATTRTVRTTFYLDSDRVGAGEFLEPEVSLATEYDLPSGDIHRFRWPFPAVTPTVTPQMRLYNAAGTGLIVPVSFDTSTLSGWNWATPASPISVSAGVYRATVNTTRYPARSGFFSGGPIVRNGITAVQGRFGSGIVAPTSAATASYLTDIDFTANSGGPVTHNADATLAATGGLTGAATRDTSTTATLASTGTLTGTAARATSTTATLAATGSLTAAGERTQTATTTLAASGALTAVGATGAEQTATLAGTGALTAAGDRTAVATAVLAATGTLAGTATAIRVASATLAATGTLTAVGDVTTPGIQSATLSGTGALSATAARTAVDTSLLAGVGALTGTGSRATSTSVTLAGLGSLTATAIVVPPGDATSAPTSALRTSSRPTVLSTVSRPLILGTGRPPT